MYQRDTLASLLRLEIPRLQLEHGRYYVGRLARVVTKSKRARTFHASSVLVGQVEGYVESSRARVVQRAQAAGPYDGVPMRLVTHETGRRRRLLHWRDMDGVVGKTPLTEATVDERMSLFIEGPAGPEPLWPWLNEPGLPLCPASWEGVFQTANERCESVLAGERAAVFTPRMARHGLPLVMLVVLNHVMDRRMGLTPEEQRDFRLLYSAPCGWRRTCSGHAQLETTKHIYLPPVADLQLWSELADLQPADGPISKGS